MKVKLLIFSFGILLAGFSHAANKMCSHVKIHGEEEIKLSETEKLLVCGDPKNPAYKHIPPYEASYFFTSFLQSRGYLTPAFKTIGGVLHVYPGEVNRVKRIGIISSEGKERKRVKKEVERLYLHKTLTPDLLNAIEGRAEEILAENGYPCAESKSLADAKNGYVELTLKEGKRFHFGDVEKEKIKGLRDNALDRYYPYHPDDLYNKKLLELNEKRFLRVGVLQGTYYLNNCSPEMKEFHLSQYFITGPPRTVRFGVGASTELGPMVRFQWSNNRYRPMASLLSAEFQASFRSQTFKLSADSFLWKKKPRQSLLSQLEVSRESQIDFEQSALRLMPHMKWTRDRQGHFQQYTIGPTYELSNYRAKEIADTRSYSAVAIQGGVQWTSHSYEFFDIHPEAGDTFGVNFDFRNKELGFPHPLLKLDSTYAQLSEWGQWGRGTLIAGVRANLGSTWVSNSVDLATLPPSVKFYGGGSNDIRGFLLNTIPDNNGLGALTKASLKLELRRTYFLVRSMELFTFVDMGRFGYQSWSLNPRLWYSPGAGVRWLSPIGLVQGYVARGLVTHPSLDQGNFYYLGLGGTF